MSRTPSLTRKQAEAFIGSADTLIVNSENRGLLRKWATSIGMKSVDAQALSNVQLANLYHEHGPRGTVAAVPYTAMPPKPVAAPATPATDAATQFATALRALIGVVPVDEGKVREIVADALADYVPPATATRLDVYVPGEPLRSLNGRVHNLTGEVIRTAALNHPIMLVGPAGCGKTTIGQHVAEALGLTFFITSTVFDTHELLGFVDGAGAYHSTAFRRAFEHGGVWVADEIDAWDAAALLAANSALANGVCTFPDTQEPIRRHPNFRVVATANTFGHGADRVYVGRNELDAASLDRFAVIEVDYDRDLETDLSNGNAEWLERVWAVRAKARSLNLRVVVSTRAIVMGVQALAAAFDQATVETRYLFKGWSSNDRAKIS